MMPRNRVALAVSLGVLLSTLSSAAAAATPSLLRVAMRIEPEDRAAFAGAYEERLLPVLTRLGGRFLTPFAARDRVAADSVFSVLYAFESPAALHAFRDSLRDQLDLAAAAYDLNREYGPEGSLTRLSIGAYETPAGTGTTVRSGPGTTIPLGRGRGHFRTFDVTDGLAGPMVTCALQDRTGDLWLGTMNNGVSRFDGQEWTTYGTDEGLTHNYVHAIHEDAAGSLWFATRRGISRFDGQSWESFTADSPVPVRLPMSIAEDAEGRLLFSCFGTGLLCYNGGTWEVLDGVPTEVVTAVLCDRQERLWIGTAVGVYRRDADEWTHFTRSDGLVKEGIWKLFEDGAGRIWASHEGHGLSRFDGATWSAVTVPDLGERPVMGFGGSADGSVWLATGGAGLYRLRGDEWRRYDTDHGLAHNIVNCAYEDREGHIWIGSTGGVSRFDDHSLSVYTRADGLPAPGVRYVYHTADGSLWFVHGDWSLGRGLSRYDGHDLTYYTTDDGLPNEDIHHLYTDRRGDLWLGHTKGATRFDGESFHTLSEADGLRDRRVNAVLQSRDGTYWFATAYGLTHYCDGTMTSYGWEDGLPSSHVTCLFEDAEGALWIATILGLARFDGTAFESWTVADGLGNPEVFDIAQAADGALWLATHGGISRFDGESFTNYSTENGLTSNDVHGVFFDRDGTLWIGTDGGGVGRFDGQVFQSLTRADGLPTNVSMSIAQDDDGYLWFSSNVGLTRHMPQRTDSYPVSIEAVVADRRYEAAGEVVVPSTVDVVAFEFRGTSLKTRPHQLVYRYRLRGHDENWHQTRDNRVEYDGLPRGDYVFEVQSVDRDLNYSEGAASVPVRITFPYERLAWFVALDVAILLVALQAVRVMRRDRRLQDSNLELKDKTAALERAHREVLQASQAKSAFLANVSHELRTPMNAIINFSALILENAYGDVSEDLRDAVAEIDRNGGDLLALINDVLDLSKIEAGAMELQLGECAPEVCIDTAVAGIDHQAAAKGLRVVREVDAALPLLWADERRLTQHVLLNLVRNAVKFTREGEVAVGAAAEDGAVLFWVRDTGCGIPADERDRVFDPFYQVDGSSARTAEGTGLGLAIVRRFVEMHGGRIWLDGEPGQGSTFRFTIPIRTPA